jgi:hypothetical protein
MAALRGDISFRYLKQFFLVMSIFGMERVNENERFVVKNGIK